jgi:hypothetical protein
MSTSAHDYAAGRVGETHLHPNVSWGAIMVGAVVAVSLGTMLNTLGLATAASLVETLTRETPTAQTMAIGTGVWLALSTAIALFLGALAAARLAHSWDMTDSALHGLAVWGVATLLAAVLLGSAVSGGVVAGLRGAGAAAGGAASAVGSAVPALTPENALDGVSGRLFGQGNPAATPREEATAEASQIFLRRIRDGEWVPQDRARLEVLVASIAGIPQPEAATRINETEATVQAALQRAEETARRAADAAARSTAIGAFWAFAALLLGLGAAVMGARSGTQPSRAILGQRRDALRG